MIELAAAVQAAALHLRHRLHLLPVRPGRGLRRRLRRLSGQARGGGVMLGVFETSIAKMRVFRVPNFLGAALMLGLLGVLLLFVSQGMCHDRAVLRHRAHAGRRAGAGQLHDAVPGPAVRADPRAGAARLHPGAVGGLAGPHPARAASLRHRGDRARLQGDRDPGGAASHRVPPGHPPRDRNRGEHRPDHARRHRPGRRCRWR